ncbi:hypothetical protein FY528_13165 [Hymenobacter lutimineralis]|uniref:Uncharacterized protein n=1 Tax=Hymenobacter lutimineralis TaxID=2606448 RepID=A0A5D6V166_9BACT|nr:MULTISPECIES: hypothetical protein [Hymenobacter]QIX59828.1 hypothetical protein HER32_00925 [Hymenobacter sp. BT18]TYZ08394.1 hypothetical protein FY528_13165 [Hymenobacter lutimineralis]
MSTKRQLIEPTPGDKRYVRRDKEGKFTSSADLNRSLSGDDRTNSKVTSKSGQGDKGDGHTGNRKPAK